MNDLQQSINIIPKYAQALLNDALLYFSNESSLATEERRAILINDIKLLKEQIEYFNKGFINKKLINIILYFAIK